MIDPLRALIAQLVAKLDAVHEDPQYKGVWTLAHIHGYNYTGLTYTNELQAVKDALLSVPVGTTFIDPRSGLHGTDIDAALTSAPVGSPPLDKQRNELSDELRHLAENMEPYHARKLERAAELLVAVGSPPPICSGCNTPMQKVDWRCWRCETFVTVDGVQSIHDCGDRPQEPSIVNERWEPTNVGNGVLYGKCPRCGCARIGEYCPPPCNTVSARWARGQRVCVPERQAEVK
jgi:hypothetical protein